MMSVAFLHHEIKTYQREEGDGREGKEKRRRGGEGEVKVGGAGRGERGLNTVSNNLPLFREDALK